MLVTTARATTKAARATVSGEMRMMVTAAMAAMAAMMMPNGDKDNDDGICCHQQCRDKICRNKSAGKRDRQLIS